MGEAARQAVAETVAVRSQRFGDYEVPAERILRFPEGLVGFPEARHFVLLDSSHPGSPFRYLLCLDLPELGFVVCDAAHVCAGYVADVPRPAEVPAEDLAVLALVTVPADPRQMTANLMAPLLVDCRSGRGRQVVLDTGRHPIRYPLLAPPATPA
ncbi:MAG: hypothetical protein E6J55_23450 [Deltaproteobacteria bacterium]|nr:MAG: hypothetical protein E6J55_23450 [Deltaproteobacteria bacterium]